MSGHEADIVTATVRTRHPDRYVLVDTLNETAWRIADDGRWIRCDVVDTAPSPNPREWHSGFWAGRIWQRRWGDDDS